MEICKKLAHARVLEAFIPEVYSSEKELYDNNGNYLEDVQKYYDKFFKNYTELLETDEYEIWTLPFDQEFRTDNLSRPLISYEKLTKYGSLNLRTKDLKAALFYVVLSFNKEFLDTESLLVFCKNKEIC